MISRKLITPLPQQLQDKSILLMIKDTNFLSKASVATGLSCFSEITKEIAGMCFSYFDKYCPIIGTVKYLYCSMRDFTCVQSFVFMYSAIC